MGKAEKYAHIPQGSRGDPNALEVARVKDPFLAVVMERSCNPNIVVYGPAISENGSWDKDTGAQVFWRRNQEDGRREELNFIQRSQAYGIKKCKMMTRDDGREACRVVLVPMSDLFLDIVSESDGTFSIISDFPHVKNVKVDRIWVQVSDSWIPGVDFVDVIGIDSEGKPATHRIFG